MQQIIEIVGDPTGEYAQAFQALRLAHPHLDPALLPLGVLTGTHVAEDGHAAGDLAVLVANWCDAIVQGEPFSMAIAEKVALLHVDRAPILKGRLEQVGDWRLAAFLLDDKDFVEMPAHGLRAAPAGEAFRDRIEQGDHARGIRGDDAVADAPEGRGQPALHAAQLLFGAAAVEGHFDRGLEFAFVKGLEHIAVGLAGPGAEQGRIVRMRRDEDDGNRALLADPRRRIDAIGLAEEMDIHEDQGRPFDQRGTHRVVRRVHTAADVVTKVAEAPFEVHGDEAFILDNEDSGWHGTGRGAGRGNHAWLRGGE